MKALHVAIRSFLTVITLLMSASASQAAISGTLSGCISTTEVRTRPALTNTTGLRWTSQVGDTVPIRRVLVKLRVTGSLLPPEFFTVTNDTGCYNITWNDPNRSAFPATGELTVIWASPDMLLGTQRTSAPPRLFTITDGLAYFDLTTVRTATLNANSTRNVTITAGEKEAAYLTSEEFYARVVRQSTALLNTMKNVFVHINAVPFSAVTPTANDVHLSGGTAVQRAFTVAHELGHIVTWRSLGLAVAPLGLQDYGCFGDLSLTHSITSRECEKAAWVEGIANTIGGAWMWQRSAPAPVIPVSTNGFSLESTADGACNTFGINREGCHARALWDIYDTNSSDGINTRTMLDIASVLRSYPDNCLPFFDNGCSNEGAANSLTHLDFRTNWLRVFGNNQATLIDPIYLNNGLVGGDPN